MTPSDPEWPVAPLDHSNKHGMICFEHRRLFCSHLAGVDIIITQVYSRRHLVSGMLGYEGVWRASG